MTPATLVLPAVPSSAGEKKLKTRVTAVVKSRMDLRPRLSACRQPTTMNPAKKKIETICMPRYSGCVKPRVLTP